MNKNLADIDRYIAEAMRVRRAVQVYDELYCTQNSVDTFQINADVVFGVIQRALHDEIVISTSRLFDSLGYRTKDGRREDYLSQFNIVSANEGLLTVKENMLRKRTAALWEELAIEKYRNLKVAHNDKDNLVSGDKLLKHGITSEKIKELLDVSIQLMLGIKCQITGSDKVSFPVNVTDKYEGYALDLLARLRKI